MSKHNLRKKNTLQPSNILTKIAVVNSDRNCVYSTTTANAASGAVCEIGENSIFIGPSQQTCSGVADAGDAASGSCGCPTTYGDYPVMIVIPDMFVDATTCVGVNGPGNYLTFSTGD